MRSFRHMSKRLSGVVLAAFMGGSLYMPAAQAGQISTTQVVQHQKVEQQRAHIQAQLQRKDVQARLKAMGVDPSKVQARVASLSDQEVQTLSHKMDQMPAGGDGLIGALVFVFIVLLITDILGLTDVFPFVKKTVN